MASAASGWRGELRAQARLALPVVAAQVGLMTMNVVDTAIAGKIEGASATSIAAVAIGGLYSWLLIGTAMGMLFSVDPLVSQALGAGDERGVARAVQRALLLAALLSVPVALLILLFAEPALALAGQPPEVVPLAARYARWLIPSIFPFLGFVVLRQTLQAKHRMKPILVVVLVANLLNLALDLGFVLGHFGMPRLGVTGIAVATSFCRWVMFLGLLWLGWPALASSLRPLRREAARWAPMRRMLLLGLPIGGQMLLEMGAFAVVALSMGRLGTQQLAGHQIALNLASYSFMVPLGISIAASVRSGRAVGAADHAALQRAARVALAMGGGVMLVFAAVFATAPELLARIYSADAGVIAMAGALLPFAAAFQVFDGLQVVCSGVLRGTADTKVPMLLHLLGFWVLGLPLSYWLAFGMGYGPRGLWGGLAIALAAVAGVLFLRVRWRLSTLPARFDLEGAG